MAREQEKPIAPREFTPEEKMAIIRQVVPPSMDKVIAQLDELVRMALDAERMDVTKPIPFAEIMKDLSLIKKALDAITADQESVKELINHLKETMPELQEPKRDKKEEKQVEKLQELGSICEAARDRLHEQLSKNPQAQRAMKEMIDDSTASTRRKAVRRKNKFRSMGGEDWIKT